ncbi:MAG: FixH family protein [Thiovulaceae bacterium]|nr:FixH family protein [Sulfurimonadaceae bacterium]
MRKEGWYWPWMILLGTFAIIWLSVYTVIFALRNPVQLSNDHMGKYSDVDKRFNDIINANIDFKKSYTLSYIPSTLPKKGTQIRYELKTLDGKAVKDAKLTVLLTRPDDVLHDIKLELDSQKGSFYTFKKVDLPLMGRWNLYTNVSVGDKKGFLNLRLDTRYPKDVLPYGTSIPMN